MTRRLEQESEQLTSTSTIPPERGSDRFLWKGFLLSLGLAAAGASLGYITSEATFGSTITTIGLKSLMIGAGTAIGFGLGIVLTGRFNVFRENVLDLRGHGELHPKSPAFHPN